MVNKREAYTVSQPEDIMATPPGLVPDSEDDKKGVTMWNIPNIQYNAKTIGWARTFMVITGGACAGVLGLTGLQGIIGFVVLYALISVSILAKVKFDLGNVLPGSTTPTFVLGGIMGELMSFLLFWTLLYGIVHVY